MADALDLGSSGKHRAGSSPVIRTKSPPTLLRVGGLLRANYGVSYSKTIVVLVFPVYPYRIREFGTEVSQLKIHLKYE